MTESNSDHEDVAEQDLNSHPDVRSEANDDIQTAQQAQPAGNTDEPATASDSFEEDSFAEDGTVLAQGALKIDVDGFEGPLDLLLMLARSQKVDLKKISIVSLVDQYMHFVEEAKRLNLELAADYLVMASWLAYLKSKLLLPKVEEEGDEISGEEMAARLQFRLQKLQAMREAGARLMARDRLGRDVFTRGEPENIRIIRKAKYEANLFDLLKVYAEQRVRTISHDEYKMHKAPFFPVEQARKRLERLFGTIGDWQALEGLIPADWLNRPVEVEVQGKLKKSATASTFLASLELAKEGKLDIRQLTAFGPIYLRGRLDPVRSTTDLS